MHPFAPLSLQLGFCWKDWSLVHWLFVFLVFLTLVLPWQVLLSLLVRYHLVSFAKAQITNDRWHFHSSFISRHYCSHQKADLRIRGILCFHCSNGSLVFSQLATATWRFPLHTLCSSPKSLRGERRGIFSEQNWGAGGNPPVQKHRQSTQMEICVLKKHKNTKKWLSYFYDSHLYVIQRL